MGKIPFSPSHYNLRPPAVQCCDVNCWLLSPWTSCPRPGVCSNSMGSAGQEERLHASACCRDPKAKLLT